MAHAGLFEGSPRPSSDSPNPLKDKQPGSNAHRGSTSTISTSKGTAWNRARALRASYKDFAKDRKETQKERRKKQIQNLTFCWAIRRCCSQEPPRAPLRAPSACYGQSISVLLLSFVSQRANPGAKPTSLAAGLSVKKHRLALFFFFFLFFWQCHSTQSELLNLLCQSYPYNLLPLLLKAETTSGISSRNFQFLSP